MERRYDIDWLRNFGILLLFPFHSARVFDHWNPFYVKSEQLDWGLSWFIALTSYWFMPLLFWLAGASCWYALRVRSNKQIRQDRIQRLFIPFVFGLLLVIPPQGYYAKLAHTGEAGSYLTFLGTFFTDFSDLSGYFGTFTPAHLWFILYLFVLSLVALPFFTFFTDPKRAETVQRFHHVFSQPTTFISFFIVLVLLQALPAPGGQNPFFFLALLIMGFISCSDARYQDLFNRIRFRSFLATLILVPLMFAFMQQRETLPYAGILLPYLRSLNTWLTLIVILGYGHQWMNFPHKCLAYFNEAAFPVYILHQTVLVVVGYYVLPLNLGVYPMFILIMVLTLVLSVLLYEWIIKRTAVMRWLFGVKVRATASKQVELTSP
ncbi:acyltransferase family protein [Ammoniphilus sp. YIM 78166]|uniref:acyltransferase family protein n=1 Tax=Ammoniphilus sp. YIM 78166 TaxID=1644106 RepID=UPI00106FD744|nr:acyltransferase family protein [Ammoniphilus sp. YIM 78166]